MTENARKKTITLTFLGLCCWNLVVAIDATALSVALPTMAQELNASSIQIFWSGTSFVLCSAALQPVFASFSSAFGRKAIIMLALILFTAGAIICGVAQHIAVLLLGRSIQGAGGGGLITMTYVIMADQFTVQERGKYTGFISMTWLVGAVCGPILGGGFTESVTWRWIFWFNIPLCAISFVAVTFFLKTNFKSDRSMMHRLKHVDWLGSLLFVASLTSFLLSVSWGGVMFAWSSWRTIMPLVLGISGLLIWGVYTYWFAKNPMIPLRLMGDWTLVASYFGTLVHGIAQFGMQYYLPLYYQAAKSYSPVISGIALLPQVLLSGPSTMVTGILIAKTASIKVFVLAGWLLFVLGLGLLNLLDASTSVTAWIFINVPCGIGLGILYAALVLAAQAAAEDPRRPIDEVTKIKAMAAGLNPFFRAVGQALGIVIGQAAFSNEMRRRLGDEVARNAAGLVHTVSISPVGSAERVAFAGSFVGCLRVVWWILFALVVSASVLSLFTRDVALTRNEPVRARIETGLVMEEKDTTGDIVKVADTNKECLVMSDAERGDAELEAAV